MPGNGTGNQQINIQTTGAGPGFPAISSLAGSPGYPIANPPVKSAAVPYWSYGDVVPTFVAPYGSMYSLRAATTSTTGPLFVYVPSATNPQGVWKPVGSGSSGGVTQIVAGTGINVSPGGGTGVVTVSLSGGGGGITSVSATQPLTATTTGGAVTIADSMWYPNTPGVNVGDPGGTQAAFVGQLWNGFNGNIWVAKSVSTGTTGIQSVILSQNPQYCYPLNDPSGSPTAEEIINNATGAYSGAVTLGATPLTGDVQGSATFGGAGRMTLPVPPSNDYTLGSAAFTIGLVYKSTTQSARLFSNGSTGGSVGFGIYQNGAVVSSEAQSGGSPTVGLTAGTTYLIHVTYSPTGTYYGGLGIYVNGTSYGTGTTYSGYSSNSTPWTLAYDVLNNTYATGSFNYLVFWPRIITTAEALAQYNALGGSGSTKWVRVVTA